MKTNYKNIVTNYILLFSIILFTSSCAYKAINYDTGPDLIIEQVSIVASVKDWTKEHPIPQELEIKLLDITIIIKNIGTKPFNSPIYIASTDTEQDFRLHSFNSFYLVEPSPTFILPDESIEINLKKKVGYYSSNMKIQVNYHTDPDKIAKEYDYFNNTYLVRH